MIKRIQLCCLVFFFLGVFLGAEALHSPTWGFRLDLPEGYELSGGDGKNQFSFASPFGAFFEVAATSNRNAVSTIAEDLEKRLNNRGKKSTIKYNGTDAIIIELQFPNPQNKSITFTGYALCMELETQVRAGTSPVPRKAFLTAVSYGPNKPELKNLHLSVLDSIEGGERDHRLPGAMTTYLYPRGKWTEKPLANSNEKAYFRENDAKAAQAVVDREFEVLKFYLNSPQWQEAWKRFYRAIFKDSFDRLGHAAFILERSWNNSILGPSGAGIDEEKKRLGTRSGEAFFIAQNALSWVQGFTYERDPKGSDFVNLVSAAHEGRGDCDSRAMLWAVILEYADISAGIMVSREKSHAMGMADLEGQGARFPMKDSSGKEIKWLVAETTSKVNIGLIDETMSEISLWLGIQFR